MNEHGLAVVDFRRSSVGILNSLQKPAIIGLNSGL
jgi:hypothetical protein